MLWNRFILRIYTLGKKGCYIPIEDNKTNVDQTFVFPLGWNWHDMDPCLFPNEIRHYLGQTFNAKSSGIVELRNHSIGGRSPKSIFTLWQLWINICIFFQKFFWLFEQCPVQPLWVLGMRCLHLPVRALSKVLLGELSTIAPNPLLCSLMDISPVCSIGAFCKTP